MAFIYEINGQRVEFDKEPTEKDIDEAAGSLGTIKPESRMPKPVEGEGGAAFGVYRPAGRRPESQQDREASKDMALQTARGIVSNVPAVLGIPGSAVNAIANAPRTAQMVQNRIASVQSQLAGNERQPEPALPEYNKVSPYDMEYFASLTPGPQPSSPAGSLAFGAGQMVGAPIVPAIPGVVKSGYQAVKEFTPAAKQFAEGAGGVISGSIAKPGVTNPEVWQTKSSRIPASETHYPADLLEKWRRGEISTEELNAGQQAWTPEQINALQRTQGNVPVENQVARAAGEQFMEPHMGLKGWIPELGAAALGGLAGGPLGGLAAGAGALGLKGYKAYQNAKQIGAFNELGKVGFTPQTAEEMTALGKNLPHPITPYSPGPVMPEGYTPPQTLQLPYNPPIQQMAPIQAAGPQRVVNIEGQRSVLPHQIDVSNSQAATPKQISMDVAASKIKPVEPTPVQPAEPAQTVQPETLAPQPGLAPLVPEGTPAQPVREPTMAERIAAMRKAQAEAGPSKEPTPKQIEREQQKMMKESQVEAGLDIIRRMINGEMPGEGRVDVMSQRGQLWGIDDTDLPNAQKGMVRQLNKAGIYELPFIEGMSEGQIIHLAFKELTGKYAERKARTPKTETPKTSPEASSLFEDLGTSEKKAPRTVEEIRKDIRETSDKSDALHESGLEAGLKPGTPAGEAHQQKLGELAQKQKQLQQELDEAKKLEKKTNNEPKNVSKMMTGEDSSWVPEKYNTKELSHAILMEGGEWKQGDLTIKYQDLGGGDARIQVRKNGQVIEEYYK